ncbi:hypothetical protein [Anaeromassilibacillus senegalensis]|uniref:hypothetical protein n=1 Tax=Anaeromassilibacillus senegalensis TaxID=1673717 RepID=UPI0006806595|nr:hypothetical protein [Anaeromassilibacillus senegalensis]
MGLLIIAIPLIWIAFVFILKQVPANTDHLNDTSGGWDSSFDSYGDSCGGDCGGDCDCGCGDD